MCSRIVETRLYSCSISISYFCNQNGQGGKVRQFSTLILVICDFPMIYVT